jgi:hypothetical protein
MNFFTTHLVSQENFCQKANFHERDLVGCSQNCSAAGGESESDPRDGGSHKATSGARTTCILAAEMTNTEDKEQIFQPSRG